MKIQTIAWVDNKVRIVDQTRLPNEFKYLFLKTTAEVFKAIKTMQVRGAPALAAAGALGVVLAAYQYRGYKLEHFRNRLKEAINYLRGCRPTAINLGWALMRMQAVLDENRYKSIPEIKSAFLKEAKKIIAQDRLVCRKLAEYGARLIKNGDRILTICNAGILATIDYGTALGVMYQAASKGRRFKVFACETRPLLQGARLSAWELKKNSIDVTLIFDSLAATLMHQKQIDKVFVGADRIASNGDTANKVGTYSLAALARCHGIPFYVAAPLSSIDTNIRTGDEIPIEQRSPLEVTHNFFRKPVAPKGIKVLNPAFDVTPHKLITAIITEKGILQPPFGKKQIA